MRETAFRIKEFTNPGGATVFCVTGYELKEQNGQKIKVRVRRNFKTYDEALGEKQKLETAHLNIEEIPLRRTRLTPEQIADCERAYAEAKEGKTMVSMVRYFNENYREPVTKCLLVDAYNQFIAAKQLENRREDTIRNLKQRVGYFIARCEARYVHEVTTVDVESMLGRNGISVVNRRNDRAAWNNFFSWCVTKRYRADHPLATIGAVTVEQTEPEVLPVNVVADLVREAAKFRGGRMVPYVVLGTFCAIRPKELSRLTWDIIDLKQKLIRLGSGVAKMRQRRIVEIPDNAVEWLKEHALRKTPIRGAAWMRDFAAIRLAIGYGTPTDEKPDLKEWVPDVMRHTGISHHLAMYEHEGKTATWAGNSPDMIHRHYKGLVTPQESKEFYAIRPAAVIKLPVEERKESELQGDDSLAGARVAAP